MFVVKLVSNIDYGNRILIIQASISNGFISRSRCTLYALVSAGVRWAYLKAILDWLACRL